MTRLWRMLARPRVCVSIVAVVIVVLLAFVAIGDDPLVQQACRPKEALHEVPW